MNITQLKAELFDIRRQIDMLDAKRQELIQLYNEKLRRLNESEIQSKIQDNSSKKGENNRVSRTASNA